MTTVFGRLSLITAAILLVTNQFVAAETHGWLGSLPLLLAGVGYVLLQTRLHQSRGMRLKRLLLGGAFIGWGIDQLLPSGRLALFLGDAVIAAFVLDLYWMAAEQQRER